jgi:hypothetical protein
MSLLSRVAERIYWSARYLERAETTSRLARVYGNLLLDLPRQAGLRWDMIVEITGCGDFAPCSSWPLTSSSRSSLRLVTRLEGPSEHRFNLPVTGLLPSGHSGFLDSVHSQHAVSNNRNRWEHESAD